MDTNADNQDSSDFEVVNLPECSEDSETSLLSGDDVLDQFSDLSVVSAEDGHPPWQGHRDKLIGLVDMGR